jgi:hypothetical protein
MNLLKKLRYQREQRARRRRLAKRYGECHVAALDAYAKTVGSFMEENPHLQPLVTMIMGLTSNGEELWGKKQEELGEFSDSISDIAFRTTACILASRLIPGESTPNGYTLSETAGTIHLLWSNSPMACKPMDSGEIANAMRRASEILKDSAADSSALMTIGEIVAGEDLLGSMFAASLVPRLAEETYHTLPFPIYDDGRSPDVIQRSAQWVK